MGCDVSVYSERVHGALEKRGRSHGRSFEWEKGEGTKASAKHKRVIGAVRRIEKDRRRRPRDGLLPPLDIRACLMGAAAAATSASARIIECVNKALAIILYIKASSVSEMKESPNGVGELVGDFVRVAGGPGKINLGNAMRTFDKKREEEAETPQ